MASLGPSRLGVLLAFCLLGALLFWRLAVPAASPWLDALALAVAGAFLLAVRSWVRGRRGRAED